MPAYHKCVQLVLVDVDGKVSSSGGCSSGGVVAQLGLVEHKFLCVWYNCPLMVASDCGRCFCSICKVNPAYLWT